MIKQSNEKYLLFFLWILATLVNINKPFHIDDTAHLEIALHIIQNPLHPLSGDVNWDNISEPIFILNQPHLYFYALAAVINIFGSSEIALHLFQSAFTFLAIFGFYKLCVLLKVKSPAFVTSIFVISPVVLINQNLMVDVPLLAAILGVFYFIIRNKRGDDYWSAILVAVCILIKYSALPLLPIWIYISLKRKQNLYPLLITVGLILLWDLFNYYDYGQVHMHGRGGAAVNTLNNIKKMIYTSTSIVGSMFIVIIALLGNKKWRLIPAFLVVILLIINLIFDVNQAINFYGLLGLFLIVGLYVFYLVFREFGKSISFLRIFKLEITNDLVLFIWMITFLLFFILESPFMATRHILLIFPVLIIMLFRETTFTASKMAGILFFQLFVTISLINNDIKFARFYQSSAKTIGKKYPKASYLGHWGWQWYASKNKNWIQYQTGVTAFTEGDIIIYPKNVNKQEIAIDSNFTVIDFYTETPPKWNLLRTDIEAGFYSNHYSNLPWIISKESIDTVFVYRYNQ